MLLSEFTWCPNIPDFTLIGSFNYCCMDEQCNGETWDGPCTCNHQTLKLKRKLLPEDQGLDRRVDMVRAACGPGPDPRAVHKPW